MKVEKDFEDFIKLLNKFEVRYLIVGAYAMALYAEPRNTGDIDFFYDRSQINVDKLLKVLCEFGFSNLNIKQKDLIEKNIVFQLGVQPVRIDLISSISGVEFKPAFNSKTQTMFGNTTAYFISKEFLIKNKRAVGRKKDLADLDLLEN